ncbi:MAG: hypothetical protein K2N38_08270 [Oscillospiraceae bacterium]|nr:hypothetical protein [Oscillospiraceae bacterium]
MKFDGLFDWIISFGAGALFTLIVSSMIYGAGSPSIIIIAAVSMLVGFIGAVVAYCLGRRRAKSESLIAYNKGIERGITLGRAEIISEHQRLVDFDN